MAGWTQPPADVFLRGGRGAPSESPVADPRTHRSWLEQRGVCEGPEPDRGGIGRRKTCWTVPPGRAPEPTRSTVQRGPLRMVRTPRKQEAASRGRRPQQPPASSTVPAAFLSLCDSGSHTACLVGRKQLPPRTPGTRESGNSAHSSSSESAWCVVCIHASTPRGSVPSTGPLVCPYGTELFTSL